MKKRTNKALKLLTAFCSYILVASLFIVQISPVSFLVYTANAASIEETEVSSEEEVATPDAPSETKIETNQENEPMEETEEGEVTDDTEELLDDESLQKEETETDLSGDLEEIEVEITLPEEETEQEESEEEQTNDETSTETEETSDEEEQIPPQTISPTPTPTPTPTGTQTPKADSGTILEEAAFIDLTLEDESESESKVLENELTPEENPILEEQTIEQGEILEVDTGSILSFNDKIVLKIAEFELEEEVDGAELSKEDVIEDLTLITTTQTDLEPKKSSETGLFMRIQEFVENEVEVSDFASAPDAKSQVKQFLEQKLQNSETTEALLDVKLNNQEITEQVAFEAGSVVLEYTPENLQPGLHTLNFEYTNPITNEVYSQEFSFAWKVLALNTPKNTYKPGELVDFHGAVLNNAGFPVCQASVSLEITNPDNTTQTITLTENEACSVFDSNNINPDYSGSFVPAIAGTYNLKLVAETSEGVRELTQTLLVEDNPAFVIERQQATRLYPFGESPASINITFNDSFTGTILETVDQDISLISSPTGQISGNTILWDVVANTGDVISLSYIYDAHDVSPDLLQIQPVELCESSNPTNCLLENRTWNIANDAATSISGILYQSDGVTPYAGAGGINLRAEDGTDLVTAATFVTPFTGAYTLVPDSTIATGDVVFIYHEDNGTDSVLIYKVGASNPTDADFRADHLTIHNDDTAAITEANIQSIYDFANTNSIDDVTNNFTSIGLTGFLYLELRVLSGRGLYIADNTLLDLNYDGGISVCTSGDNTCSFEMGTGVTLNTEKDLELYTSSTAEIPSGSTLDFTSGTSRGIIANDLLINGTIQTSDSAIFGINVEGDLEVGASASLEAGDFNDITFLGSGTQNFTSNGNAFDVPVNITSATEVILQDTFSTTGILNITNSSGIFDLNGQTASWDQIDDNTGTIQLQGTETLTITNKTTSAATGTWEYYGDGVTNPITIFNTTSTNAPYYTNLIINDTNATSNYTRSNATMIVDNFTITDGTFDFTGSGVGTITVNDTFTLEPAGTLTLDNQSMDAQHWINNGGTFNAGTSYVTLDDSDGTSPTTTTLSGNNTFYNLVSNAVNGTGETILTVEAGTTQQIQNFFQGFMPTTMVSSSPPTQYTFEMTTGSNNIFLTNDLTVSDSILQNGTGGDLTIPFSDPNLFDGGNTVGWDGASQMVGTLYESDRSTPLVGKLVSMSVDGAAGINADAVTNASGQFTITTTAPAADAVLTFYIDNETEDGVTVTKATGSGMSGLEVYENHLAVFEDNSNVSPTDMDTADNSADADITTVFDGAALNVKTGFDLYIPTGETVDWSTGPGINADGGVFIAGTLNLGSTNITAADDFYKLTTGTLTATGSITFDGSGNVQNYYYDPLGTSTFSDFIINDVALVHALTDVNLGSGNLTIGQTPSSSAIFEFFDTILYMSGGTFSNEGTLKQSFLNYSFTGGTVFDTDSGTMEVAGRTTGSTSGTGNYSNNPDFYNLVISGGRGGTALVSGSSFSFDVANDFTITDNSFANAGPGLTVGGNFEVSGGTFNGSDAPIDVEGNMTVTGGTFTDSSSTTNVAGDFTGSAFYTANNGELILDGTDQNVFGSSTFYKFTKNLPDLDTSYTLGFEDGTTQVFTNYASLKGDDTGTTANMNIRSVDSGGLVQGLAAGTTILDFQYSAEQEYLDVQNNDANSTNSAQILPINPLPVAASVDSGGNTDWFGPTSNVTLSGILYDTDLTGTTPLTNKTVRLIVDGENPTIADTALTTTTDVTTGAFSFSINTGDYQIDIGDAIAIYIEGETEKGMIVSNASGTDQTDLDFFQSTVTVDSSTENTDVEDFAKAFTFGFDNTITDITDLISSGYLVNTSVGLLVLNNYSFYVPTGETVDLDGNLFSFTGPFQIEGTVNTFNTTNPGNNNVFVVSDTFDVKSGGTFASTTSDVSQLSFGGVVTVDGTFSATDTSLSTTFSSDVVVNTPGTLTLTNTSSPVFTGNISFDGDITVDNSPSTVVFAGTVTGTGTGSLTVTNNTDVNFNSDVTYSGTLTLDGSTDVEFGSTTSFGTNLNNTGGNVRFLQDIDWSGTTISGDGGTLYFGEDGGSPANTAINFTAGIGDLTGGYVLHVEEGMTVTSLANFDDADGLVVESNGAIDFQTFDFDGSGFTFNDGTISFGSASQNGQYKADSAYDSGLTILTGDGVCDGDDATPNSSANGFYYDLTIDDTCLGGTADDFGISSSMTVYGDFITNETIEVSGSPTITFFGDADFSGGFSSPDTSTVVFSTANGSGDVSHTVTNQVVFYNLTVDQSGQGSGNTYINFDDFVQVTNNITLRGEDASNRVYLGSKSPGARVRLLLPQDDPVGSYTGATFEYLTISDNRLEGTPNTQGVCVYNDPYDIEFPGNNLVDGGNTACWFDTATFSGTVYQDIDGPAGAGPVGAGVDVRMWWQRGSAVNDGLLGSDTTDASGNFQIDLAVPGSYDDIVLNDFLLFHINDDATYTGLTMFGSQESIMGSISGIDIRNGVSAVQVSGDNQASDLLENAYQVGTEGWFGGVQITEPDVSNVLTRTSSDYTFSNQVRKLGTGTYAADTFALGSSDSLYIESGTLEDTGSLGGTFYTSAGSGGTFTVGTGTTLRGNAATQTAYSAGDFVTYGTLDLSGAGHIKIDGNFIAGTAATGIDSDINTGDEIRMQGSTTQNVTFNGSTIELDFRNENTSAPVVLLDAMNLGANNLEIASGSEFQTAGNDLTITTLDNEGTLELTGTESTVSIATMDVDSGTVEYVGDSDGTPNEDFTVIDFGATDYYNLVINSATNPDDFVLSGTGLDIANNFTITSGEFEPGAQTLNVAGSFSNQDTFTAGGSTLVLDGASQQNILGTTTFNNFTISDTGTRTVGFQEDITQTIGGIFTSDLSTGNEVTIRTVDSAGVLLGDNSQSTLNIDIIGGASLGTIDFINVQDSILQEDGVEKDPALEPSDSTDVGNTAGWFNNPNIRGTVYTDEGVTTAGAGLTVRAVLNGITDLGTASTLADGTFSISPLATINADDIVAVYLDDETQNSVSIVSAAGGGTGADVDLWNEIYTLDSEDGGTIVPADLDTAKAYDTADMDFYTSGSFYNFSHGMRITAGTTVDWDDTILATSENLYVDDNATFNVGDANGESWQSANGVATLGNNAAVYNAGGGTTVVAGDIILGTNAIWDNNNAFFSINGDITMGTGASFPDQVYFILTDTNPGPGSNDITSNGYVFPDLIVVQTQNARLLDDLNMGTNGITVDPDEIFDLNGNSVIGTGTLQNDGTVRAQGTESFGLTNDTDSGTWEFYGDNSGSTVNLNSIDNTFFNLTINDTNATENTYETTANLTINNNLTITDGIFDANDDTHSVLGDLSVAAAATFTADTSTISLDGTANQNLLGDITFENFTIADTGARTIGFQEDDTYTIGGALTIDLTTGNDVIIRTVDSSGTELNDGSQHTINVDLVGGGSLGTIDFVNVRDSILQEDGATKSPELDPSSSQDAGNNAGWFPPAASGIVYTDMGVTPQGAGITVRAIINGVTDLGTTTTDANGYYSIPLSPLPSAGDVVAVYIDDGTQGGNDDALGLLSYSTNSANIDLWDETIQVKSDDGSVLDQSDLATAVAFDTTDMELYTYGTTYEFDNDISLRVASNTNFTLDDTLDITESSNSDVQLLIQSGGSITVGDSFAEDFTSSGAVDVILEDNANYTDNAAAGTMRINGDLTVGDGADFNALDQFLIVSGSLTAGGASTVIDGFTYIEVEGANITSNGYTFTDRLTIGGTNVALTDNLNTGTQTLEILNSSSTLDLAGFDVAGSGTLLNNGTIKVQSTESFALANDTDSGTIEWYGTGSAGTTSINSFSTDFFNLTINDTNATSRTYQTTTDININGDFSVLDGTFDGNDDSHTVGGDISVAAAGTFTADTSTFTLDGTADQNIFGDMTFENLTIGDTGARILGIEEDKTITIGGVLTSDLTTGNEVSIRTINSSGTVLTDNSQHTINVDVTGGGSIATVDFVDVRDSILQEDGVIKSPELSPSDSTNSGNTSGWFPPVISGTVYTDKGVTTAGAGLTVRASLNGVTDLGSTTTAADGTYSITAGSAISAGDILSVHLDNEVQNSVAIISANGSDTTVDLWDDMYTFKSDDGGTLTQADYSTAVAFDVSDMSFVSFAALDSFSMGIRVTNGSTLTWDNTILATFEDLYVDDGATFTVGDASGEFYDSTGGNVVIGDSANVTLSGGGIVNANVGNLTIGANSTWESNSGIFYVYGNASFDSTMTISNPGAMFMQNGGTTLTSSGYTMTMPIFLAGSGAVTVTDALDMGTNALNISSISNLNLDGNDLLNVGTLSNDGTIQFQGVETFTGTMDSDSGTVEFVGDNSGSTIDINSYSSSFFNLTINDANVTENTYESTANLDINGSLTLTDGVFDANDDTHTVGGDLSIAVTATFTADTSTISLDGTSDQDIFGTWTFEGFNFADSGARIIGFVEDTTYTVGGAFAADLTTGNEVSIRTIDSGGTVLNDSSQHTLNVDLAGGGSIGTVDFVDVRDSILQEDGVNKFPELNPSDSTDSTNNIGWFGPDTIYGVVYSDLGVSNAGSGISVVAAKNGTTLVGSDTTDASGNYSIDISAAGLVAGDEIVVFLDGHTSQGFGIIKYDSGSANMDIWYSSIFFLGQTGQTLDGTELTTAAAYDADITGFTVDATPGSEDIDFDLTTNWYILDNTNIDTIYSWRQGANGYTGTGSSLTIENPSDNRFFGVDGDLQMFPNSTITADEATASEHSIDGSLIMGTNSTIDIGATQAIRVRPGAGGSVTLGSGSTFTGTLSRYVNFDGIDGDPMNLTVSDASHFSSLTNVTFSDGEFVLQANTDFGNATRLFSDAIIDANGFDVDFGTQTFFDDDATIQLQGTETLTYSSFETDEGTIEFYGDNSGSTVNLNSYFSQYYNLVINDTNATENTYETTANLDIEGSLTVTDGIFDANDDTHTVAGNISVADATATFTADTSTFQLDGTADQNIFGNITFDGFTISDTGARTVGFEEDKTYTYVGAFTSDLTTGNEVNIRTIDNTGTVLNDGSQHTHNIDLVGGGTLGTIDFIDVRDSILQEDGATKSPVLNPANSTNSGNQAGWFTSVQTIGGTVYTDTTETTPIGSVQVRAVLNGTTDLGTATTNGSGVYSISPLAAVVSPGDIVNVYIDDATENGMTLLSFNSDASDINIYQDFVTFHSDDGTAFTNTHIDTSDNLDPGTASDDISSLLAAVSATDVSTAAGVGYYFTPNTSFNDSSFGGNGSNPGDLIMSAGSSATTTSGFIGPFGNVTIPATASFTSSNAAFWTVYDNFDLTGTLTLDSGNELLLQEDFILQTGATLNVDNIRFANGESGNITTNGITLNADITFDKSGGTHTLTDALVQAASYNWTVQNGSVLDLAGNDLTIATGGTETWTSGELRLHGSETITNVTNSPFGVTWVYYGDEDGTPDEDFTIKDFGAGQDYGTLQINSTTNPDDFTLGSDLTISTIQLLSGELEGGSNTITVYGTWSNSGGVFTANTSTVDFWGGTTFRVLGTTTFNNLTVSALNASQTIGFEEDTTTTVNGILTADGGASNAILWRTVSNIGVELNDGSQHTLNVDVTGGGSFGTIDYVDVRDSILQEDGVTKSPELDPADSTDNGNNAGWFADVLLSGQVTDARGGSGINGMTVRLLVDGVDSGVTVESANNAAGGGQDGEFLFPSGPAIGSADVVTLYLDDETQNGVYMELFDGTKTTGIDIVQDYFVVDNQTGFKFEFTEMDLGDDGEDETSSTLVTPDTDISDIVILDSSRNFSTGPGVGMWLKDGFNINYNSSGLSPYGDIDINGELYMESLWVTKSGETNNFYVAGDFYDDAGFLSIIQGDLYLDGTGDQNFHTGGEDVIMQNTGSARTIYLTKGMTSHEDVTIESEITFDTQNYRFRADTLSNEGTVRTEGGTGHSAIINTQDIDSGTWEYYGNGDGSAQTGYIYDIGAVDYYNLVINDPSATNRDTFQQFSANDVTVANDFTVTSGTFNVLATDLAVGGNFTIGPDGVVDLGTSPLTDFNGNVANTGSLDLGSVSLTVAGNWSNTGTGSVTADTSTVTFDSADGVQQNILGTTTFNNVTLSDDDDDGAGRTVGFEEDQTQTIGGALTIDNSASDLVSIRTVDSGGTVLNDNSQSTINIDITGGGSVGTIDFVDVRDSILQEDGVAKLPELDPADSNNSGNTAGWFAGFPLDLTFLFEGYDKAGNNDFVEIDLQFRSGASASAANTVDYTLADVAMDASGVPEAGTLTIPLTPGDYFVLIAPGTTQNRINHFPVMTGSAITFNGTSNTVNFTDGSISEYVSSGSGNATSTNGEAGRAGNMVRDGNKQINTADLLTASSAFGCTNTVCGITWEDRFDLNGDNSMIASDLLLISANFGISLDVPSSYTE